MTIGKMVKISLTLLLLVLILSFSIIGIHNTWKEYFSQEYDSHLTQKEYKETVLDQNVNLVFYKVGCPYCQIGKKGIVKAAKKGPYPTFYINIESEEGQELLKKYRVEKAATLVTIRGGNSQLYVYAAKDEKGHIEADQYAIRKLLNE